MEGRVLVAEEDLQKHLKRAEPFATAYQERVRRLQNAYVPPYNPVVKGWDTDFMPKREGQAYYPIPIVWFTVNVMASMMGMRPPIFNVEPKTSDIGDREDAAATELLLRYEQQRQVMREVHLDLCKVLSLKGRAGVKVGYDGKDLWTENIDNIENLWTSWENDSYRRAKAYSYHSIIDIDTARQDYGYTEEVQQGNGFWGWVNSTFNRGGATKSDVLGRWSATNFGIPTVRNNPDFHGVNMIDFHYKRPDGKVVNEVWIGSQKVREDVLRLDEFPYITINCDSEPGNPFGIGDAEPVQGLQAEIAGLKTKWHEAIRRNGLDTWIARNMKGVNPIDLDGGGRYFMVQGTREEQNIEPLKYPIDDIGYRLAVDELWEDYRRITGIPPEVLGGGHISAGTSGYAMAVKFQSVITRLGPRQTRFITFYQTWSRLTLKHVQIVDPTAKELIKNNYFTGVDFENVTPKDFAQQVSALATAVSARFLSQRTAMEEIGKVSEDEIEYIKEWNRDPETSPQTAAAIQMVEGQTKQAQQGNPAAIGNAVATAQNQGMPSMGGENQHTQTRISQPGAANPVVQSPPGISG